MYYTDFGWALSMLRQGKRVQRSGWNGREMYLYLVPGSVFSVNREPLLSLVGVGTRVTYQPHIDMVTANGTIVPWLCSQSDMLAEDWQEVE